MKNGRLLAGCCRLVLLCFPKKEMWVGNRKLQAGQQEDHDHSHGKGGGGSYLW